jgi:hypothetical protein
MRCQYDPEHSLGEEREIIDATAVLAGGETKTISLVLEAKNRERDESLPDQGPIDAIEIRAQNRDCRITRKI